MSAVNLFDPFNILPSIFKTAESGLFSRQISDMIMECFEATPFPAVPDNRDPTESEYKTLLLETVKDNAAFARKCHGLATKQLKETIEFSKNLSDEEKQRIRFWTEQMIKALSPSNFFWTNSLAVRRFLETNGESIFNGMKNCMRDIRKNMLPVGLCDPDAFKIGEDLAYTPGEVVFRNDLMELIQYTPSTKKTFTVPIVLIQPWINKYYIFDLTETSSLVRYLRDQQFTVFITSWKNPGPEMRTVDFEDYMFRGALQAVQTAMEICRVNRVHAAGYCIGGTLLAAMMAWLNRKAGSKESVPVGHWTTFSTLVDFSSPGEIEVFISENMIETIESMMKQAGYLAKEYLEMTFRMLKPDSLIWRYFSHNYLMGGEVPKSDVLFWNCDGTRLPEKMASIFLRDFYLENKLCQKDRLKIGGLPIDLGRIRQPLYGVGALQDHICPWKETFKTSQMIGGPTRYVATSDGHIAGIVNPPSTNNRKKFMADNVSIPEDADRWYSNHTPSQGSWWTDWTHWLSGRCGPLTSPHAVGSRNFPPIDRAPGTYVLER